MGTRLLDHSLTHHLLQGESHSHNDSTYWVKSICLHDGIWLSACTKLSMNTFGATKNARRKNAGHENGGLKMLDTKVDGIKHLAIIAYLP